MKIQKVKIELYPEEVKNLLFYRTTLTLWLGIILVPFFSILDYFVVPEHFVTFLSYRLICSLLLALLLYLHMMRFFLKIPLLTPTLEFIFICLAISLMIIKLGGYDSFYYSGIILVLVSCSALLPLTALQSICLSFLFYFLYAGPIFIFSSPTPDNLKIFFNNSFFFASFTLISAVISHESSRARKKEYKLRTDLNENAKKLAYYAENLEEEVKKRTIEIKETELRYKELYENIIDMLVLVDQSGDIIMANPQFYKSLEIHDENYPKNRSLLNFVPEKEISNFQKKLLNRLQVEQEARGIQFKMKTKSGKYLDVECNATRIQRSDSPICFQIVIRDISLRKKLELDLMESYRSLAHARGATILGLAKLAEYRDLETGRHLERIREYSRMLAKELSQKNEYKNYVSPKYIEDIYQSAILHDIGKVGISDSILLKPGALNEKEFNNMKLHTVYGGDILNGVDSTLSGQSFLSMGKTIAYSHHEKWDGTGYPNNLKGKDIPLSARCVALADVYDALTNARPYKTAFSHEKAKDIILSDTEKHFDPDVVDCFVKLEAEFKTILTQTHGKEKETEKGLDENFPWN